MQIEIKEIEPCKIVVNYEADAEQILNKRSEVLNTFKKAPVKGWNKNHAPLEVIKTVYRKQIDEALKRALTENAYHDTIFEKHLRPHGAPKFNTMFLGDGKFTCEFELYTKPDFELSPYLHLDLPKPSAQYTETEFAEKMLQDIRVRLGDTMPYSENDFVQNGDSIIIDYDGAIDGNKIDTLSAQGEMRTVGDTQMLASFDDNLLGMKQDEIREFDIVVPQDGLPSIAGKTVHMKVSLTMGSKTTPHALDNELAVKLGLTDLDQLRERVKITANQQLEQSFSANVIEAIANRLVNDNIFMVPDWMKLSEAQYVVHNAKLEWNKLTDQDKEKYLQMADKNVRLALILEKIRENEPEAQLTDQEVFEVVKNNLAKTQLNTPMDEILGELNRTGMMQVLFSRIRDQFTLDYIVKNTRIVE